MSRYLADCLPSAGSLETSYGCGFACLGFGWNRTRLSFTFCGSYSEWFVSLSPLFDRRLGAHSLLICWHSGLWQGFYMFTTGSWKVAASDSLETNLSNSACRKYWTLARLWVLSSGTVCGWPKKNLGVVACWALVLNLTSLWSHRMF